MTPYLRQILKERREQQAIPLVAVSPHVGLRESNLSRIETGGAGYITKIDRIVEGYAEALGVDPREIWREALERWEADKRPPRQRRR